MLKSPPLRQTDRLTNHASYNSTYPGDGGASSFRNIKYILNASSPVLCRIKTLPRLLVYNLLCLSNRLTRDPPADGRVQGPGCCAPGGARVSCCFLGPPPALPRPTEPAPPGAHKAYIGSGPLVAKEDEMWVYYFADIFHEAAIGWR